MISAEAEAESERRCDPRCHAATWPRCACWCRGAYHGLGEPEARRRMIRDHGFGVVRSGGLEPAGRGDGPLFAPALRARMRGRELLADAARFIRERLSS